MIDFVNKWLIGITIAAIVGAVAEWMTPEGASKKVGKLASGLLLMVAVLKPIVGLDYEALTGALTNYRMESQGYGEQLEIENERLMKIIIEEQTAAYIQDKASELSIDCMAEVKCGTDSNGDQIPQSVIIYGDLSLEEETRLSRIIEGELALRKEYQRYERANVS